MLSDDSCLMDAVLVNTSSLFGTVLGSCVVENLGFLSPLSDCAGCLLPIDFRYTLFLYGTFPCVVHFIELPSYSPFAIHAAAVHISASPRLALNVLSLFIQHCSRINTAVSFAFCVSAGAGGFTGARWTPSGSRFTRAAL